MLIEKNDILKCPMLNNVKYFMAGFGMNMNILVPNENLCVQIDLFFKVSHKEYAARKWQVKDHHT